MYVATYIFWVFIYYIIKYDIITIPVRDFHHPQPQEQIIRESVDRFLAAIDRSLRIGCYRDTTRRIAFYMKFLRQKTTLTLRDFNSAYFCSGWNQCYQQFGTTQLGVHDALFSPEG